MSTFLTDVRMQISAHFWLLRSKFWASQTVYPKIMAVWAALRQEVRDRRVTEDTEIVIEGFPRSSNTFAVYAFEYSQQRPVKIAHHLHDGFQIVEAIRRNIPCVVLIRDPRQSITSWLMKSPQLRPEELLKVYISFYEVVLNNIDKISVFTYEEVTNDFNKVISTINQLYSKNYLTFSHTDENIKEIFARIDRVRKTRVEKSRQIEELASAFPTKQKQLARGKLLADMEEKFPDALKKATQIYSAVLEGRMTFSAEKVAQ